MLITHTLAEFKSEFGQLMTHTAYASIPPARNKYNNSDQKQNKTAANRETTKMEPG